MNSSSAKAGEKLYMHTHFYIYVSIIPIGMFVHLCLLISEVTYI